METGLALGLPGLAAALRRWRRRDPAARLGMPPHVTLIHPFTDSRSVDPGVRARIVQALTGFGPLDLVFDRPGAFEGGLWLELADPGPVREMIAALARAFPDHPPYGGAFAEVIPHLTVAQAPAAILARIRRELEPRLPLRAHADVVGLYGRMDVGWAPLETFPLAG